LQGAGAGTNRAARITADRNGAELFR